MNMLNYCYIPLDFFGGFAEVLGIFRGIVGVLGGIDGSWLDVLLSSLGGLGGGSLGGGWRFVGGFQRI